MKTRIIFIFIISCILLSAGILIAETNKSANTKPDIIAINRIKITSENTADFSNFTVDAEYDFTIVSLLAENYGMVLYSTLPISNIPLTERINNAISHHDTIVDYEKNGIIEGKIIIYTGQILEGNRTLRLIAVIVPLSGLCLLVTLYYFYMRIYLYRPFKRLQGFATQIASGDFDIPLPMDKDNLFGVFSESFDLMRVELKIARQLAIDEEISKKELIAAISHDIKTPISIIQAASELLEINEADQKKLTTIKAIKTKTLEIDTLITDLFSSALEDLSELKIDLQDVEITSIKNIIVSADSMKKITFIGTIPDCLVKADSLRLAQVFGNIISNSYKYADTPIETSFVIIDNYLKISFKDFGNTLTKEDIPLLKNKFYRGNNARGQQGAGLGLYICAKLIDHMHGSLDLLLEKDGLRVDVSLALS